MSEQKFVLIIEDAPEIAEIFSEILQGQGLATQIVSDGATAMEILMLRKPSLVLLDMHLPNVSGRDILAQIRASADLGKTKVIAVTADALVATSVEDMADLVLIKPVTYSQIVDLTRRMILPQTAPLVSPPEPAAAVAAVTAVGDSAGLAADPLTEPIRPSDMPTLTLDQLSDGEDEETVIAKSISQEDPTKIAPSLKPLNTVEAPNKPSQS